jgi:hypothetical protein
MRIRRLLLAFLIACFQLLGPAADALVADPREFGEPVPIEWRAPIGKFVGALGAGDPQAALNNSIAMKVQRDPAGSEADTNTILVQVRYGSFCQAMTEGCLTVIGRISGDAFQPEVMFFAGNRMNAMDTVPRALGALSRPMSFWGKSMAVSVINTPQGWVVLPVKQTNPPR